jgi:hypothetical protein
MEAYGFANISEMTALLYRGGEMADWFVYISIYGWAVVAFAQKRKVAIG